ncbi:MAG: penicillin-binding protein 1C [Chthoniobacterales bacterium]
MTEEGDHGRDGALRRPKGVAERYGDRTRPTWRRWLDAAAQRPYLACFGLIVAAGAVAFCRLPIPPALLQPPAQSITLLDRHGTPLREARVEERFSRELAIADVPRHVINAVLAAEDKRFFRHRGVDWLATGRALANAITRRHVTSGASTITQQLVKICERRPRTLGTKVIESAIALRLEQLWSKEQILCAYLNRVDFGNLNVGLCAAADYYFGKPVADLSEAEAALLAALPRNPRKLNPHIALEKAQVRQQRILRRMHETGWLDLKSYETARTERLHLRVPRRHFRAPHFTELLLQESPEITGPEVRTTLDLPLNEEVERILRKPLAQLREHNVHDGAAVVIDTTSGDVIALVGSADYFAPLSGQVNGAWAKRSAGSTLKPFTYLLALERGATPATMVADVRTSFPASDGFYRPENYNRRCYGPVTYRTALASSLNIPAVKVLLAGGGPAALHGRLRTCGLTTLEEAPEIYGLGLTLGNCEARLLELTNAYASLARLGVYRPWRVLADAPSFSRAYSRPELVWQIADILSDNSARTLAFGINSALRYQYPVACKTGTSTDFRDNWAIGFTPEYTVGVWVGNFDGDPMHEVSGVTGAGPILHGIFDYLHAQKGTSWYRTPPQIIERSVHPLTGKLLADSDARAVREKFVAGNIPPAESPDDYDIAGNVRLPQEYSEWLASGENSLRGQTRVAQASEPLRITSPLGGSTYLIDPDVRTSGRIPLAASSGGKLQWESDSLQCVREGETSFALAVAGEHRLRVIEAETGRRAEVQISVKSL